MMNCATCALRQICSESRAKHIPLEVPPPLLFERFWDKVFSLCFFVGAPALMAAVGYCLVWVSGISAQYISPIVVEVPQRTPMVSASNQSGPSTRFVFAESARPAPIAGSQKIFEQKQRPPFKVVAV